MGVFDKFLDIMKLNDDEYDDDDFYDDDFEDDDFDENRIVQFSETRRAEVMILMISIWTRTSILLHPLEIK